MCCLLTPCLPYVNDCCSTKRKRERGKREKKAKRALFKIYAWQINEMVITLQKSKAINLPPMYRPQKSFFYQKGSKYAIIIKLILWGERRLLFSGRSFSLQNTWKEKNKAQFSGYRLSVLCSSSFSFFRPEPILTEKWRKKLRRGENGHFRDTSPFPFSLLCSLARVKKGSLGS